MKTELDLFELVRENDWVIGAINFDEDLHFSSYYLRASTPRSTAQAYPGYNHILAFYEDFTERYYLLRDECRLNAEAVVRRALGEPTWFPRVLLRIRELCDELTNAFPADLSERVLRAYSDAELCEVYRRHHDAHSELYQWARLPETLDRGINCFTNYLKRQLTAKGLPDREASEVFLELTHPEEPSILLSEVLEFERVVEKVRGLFGVSPLIRSYPRRVGLLLSPAARHVLDEYVEKWKYLDYHGYGRRELRTLPCVLERLIHQLEHDSSVLGEEAVRSRFAQARARREEVFAKLAIDPAHRALFKTYPEIGALKLYRRYCQLRNFYFLDMVLAEIAQRLDVDEWSVRCMLPEELLSTLGEHRSLPTDLGDRRHSCLFSIIGGNEQVWTGKPLAAMRHELERRSSPHRDRRLLKGVVASKGHVRGTCKVVIRANEQRGQFAEGSILVSGSTDPDILGLLRIAGGVLTQEGGVTAHAAIICRELGIPAVVGIPGLLDAVRDGDAVEIDASSGEVRVLTIDDEPPPGTVLEFALGAGRGLTGSKAHNLWIALECGFRVPEFVVLRSSGLVALLAEPELAARQQLTRWMARRLGVADIRTDVVAVRSSALNEDLDESSQAGAHRSVLNVGWENLWAGVTEFFELNGSEYAGAVVVQRMVVGEAGGVCLTDGCGTEYQDSLVVEFDVRGAMTVTAGAGYPSRFVIARGTGDILFESNRQDNNALVHHVVRGAVPLFIELERYFGHAVDVEWVIKGGNLYVLQVRPVTVREGRR